MTITEKTLILNAGESYPAELMEFPGIVYVADSVMVNGHTFRVKERVSQINDMDGHIVHTLLCFVTPEDS